MRTNTWILAMCVAYATAPAVAQDDPETDVQRIVRDQRTVKDRLQKIEARMSRLADKLEERNPYQAGLLRKALADLTEKRIDDRIDELIPDVSSRRFTSVDGQKEILQMMEGVYAILLDRNDLDKLEEDIQKLQAGIQEIKRLRSEQRDIINQTERLTQSEAQVAEAARQQLAELMRQQQEVMAQTEQASSDGTESTLGMQQQLDSLADRQKGELDRTRDAIEEVVGKALERLDQAIEAETSAIESLDREPEARRDGDSVMDKIARQLEKNKRASKEADAESSQGSESQSGETESGEPGESSQGTESESGDSKSGEPSGEQSESSQGSESQPGESSESRSGESMSQQARDRFLGAQSRAEDALDKLDADDLAGEGEPSPDAVAEAARLKEALDPSLERASRAMSKARQAAERGDASQARQQAEEAVAGHEGGPRCAGEAARRGVRRHAERVLAGAGRDGAAGVGAGRSDEPGGGVAVGLAAVGLPAGRLRAAVERRVDAAGGEVDGAGGAVGGAGVAVDGRAERGRGGPAAARGARCPERRTRSARAGGVGGARDARRPQDAPGVRREPHAGPAREAG